MFLHDRIDGLLALPRREVPAPHGRVDRFETLLLALLVPVKFRLRQRGNLLALLPPGHRPRTGAARPDHRQSLGVAAQTLRHAVRVAVDLARRAFAQAREAARLVARALARDDVLVGIAEDLVAGLRGHVRQLGVHFPAGQRLSLLLGERIIDRRLAEPQVARQLHRGDVAFLAHRIDAHPSHIAARLCLESDAACERPVGLDQRRQAAHEGVVLCQRTLTFAGVRLAFFLRSPDVLHQPQRAGQERFVLPCHLAGVFVDRGLALEEQTPVLGRVVVDPVAGGVLHPQRLLAERLDLLRRDRVGRRLGDRLGDLDELVALVVGLEQALPIFLGHRREAGQEVRLLLLAPPLPARGVEQRLVFLLTQNLRVRAPLLLQGLPGADLVMEQAVLVVQRGEQRSKLGLLVGVERVVRPVLVRSMADVRDLGLARNDLGAAFVVALDVPFFILGRYTLRFEPDVLAILGELRHRRSDALLRAVESQQEVFLGLRRAVLRHAAHLGDELFDALAVHPFRGVGHVADHRVVDRSVVRVLPGGQLRNISNPGEGLRRDDPVQQREFCSLSDHIPGLVLVHPGE